VRWNLELTRADVSQELTVGGGGAITWLSDREEEWAEVEVKVSSVSNI
jgi:anthranilate/para-aminobenzoate synthase component I